RPNLRPPPAARTNPPTLTGTLSHARLACRIKPAPMDVDAFRVSLRPVDDPCPRAPAGRRRVVPLSAAIVTALGTVLAGTALADGPLAGARDPAAQARVLAAKIDALQPQVDAALASYDRALEGVALAVGRNAAAEESYE